MIDKILNMPLGLKQLAKLFGTYNTSIYKEWKLFFELSEKLDPGHSNGRVNHTWIQKMICDLSNGYIKYGGQGSKKSDCTIEEMRVETKSFISGADEFHSAASSFFANNCKVADYKKLMKRSKRKARRFVFEHSYDKNDYYLLTGTAKLSCSFDKVEIMLVDKQVVIDNLKPDFIKCSMANVRKSLKETLND